VLLGRRQVELAPDGEHPWYPGLEPAA
jgi:hypothetical protein